MGSSPYEEQNRFETTSTQPRGGCFSAIFSPMSIIIGLVLFFLVATGETTRPFELPPAAQAEVVETQSEVRLAPFFAPSVQYWEDKIIRWADAWGFDPNLVATVMQIESCGDPNAVSSAGAMGLFQVMPYHFLDGDDPYKPNINAKRGMAYLRQAMDTYGTVKLALASYNGGIGTAAKPVEYWPEETVRYVYWGTGIYKAAKRGEPSSDRLEEWLNAGGSHLCQQAEERLGINQ